MAAVATGPPVQAPRTSATVDTALEEAGVRTGPVTATLAASVRLLLADGQEEGSTTASQPQAAVSGHVRAVAVGLLDDGAATGRVRPDGRVGAVPPAVAAAQPSSGASCPARFEDWVLPPCSTCASTPSGW